MHPPHLAFVTEPMTSSAASQSTLRTVLVLLRMYPRRTATVILLLLGSGFAEAVGMVSILPILTITDDGSGSSSALGKTINSALGSVGMRPTLGSLLLLVVLGLTLKAFLLMVALRQAGYAAVDVATDLRLDLVRRLMRARWSFFTGRSVGAVTNAVSGEAIRAGSIYSETCLMIAALIQALTYAFLSIFISWYLLLFGIGVGLLLFVAFRHLIRMSSSGGRAETESFISLTSRFADVVAAIKPLKAMGRQSAAQALIETDVRQINAAQRRLALGRVSMTAFQEPMIGAVMGIGLYVTIRRFNLAFDEVLFMAIMLQRVITRLGNAQTFYQSVSGLESSFWSLRSTIDAAALAAEVDTGVKRPSLDSEIALKGVSFSYDTEQILRDVDMVVPARRITAVIGPSGTGKTTLVDLISGLNRPTQGEVFVDGCALSEISLLSWRNKIGYVPQEMVLLHDSIFNNVSMRDPSVTSDDVEQALTAAEAWEFVSRMPERLDTIVGERGVRLSGGQRQRLSLARALVNRPWLLILDEPTTALDPATEASIFETLRHLSRLMTILAISHQRSLTDAADVVYQLLPLQAGAGKGTAVDVRQAVRTK